MKGWILLMLAVFLVACRPISRGPVPPIFDSPLARGMVSPLARGVAGPTVPPDEDRALRADDAEVAAQRGSIPPLPRLPYRLYAPILAHQATYPCAMNGMALALYMLFKTDPEQKRAEVNCDPILVHVAQRRADDMVSRGYFNHYDPDGWGPNHWLLVGGCHLPDGYPENGNSGESITLNYFTAEVAWAALKRSPYHRPHVLGEHEGWRKDRLVGIGWAANAWGAVFVVETAPGC